MVSTSIMEWNRRRFTIILHIAVVIIVLLFTGMVEKRSKSRARFMMGYSTEFLLEAEQSQSRTIATGSRMFLLLINGNKTTLYNQGSTRFKSHIRRTPAHPQMFLQAILNPILCVTFLQAQSESPAGLPMAIIYLDICGKSEAGFLHKLLKMAFRFMSYDCCNSSHHCNSSSSSVKITCYMLRNLVFTMGCYDPPLHHKPINLLL